MNRQPKPPTKLEPKAVDPEAELSNAQRTYLKLAPMCSIERKMRGQPQLATQRKQMSILTNEMNETLLCINLARKGQHAVRDGQVKSKMQKSIIQYDSLETEVKDERGQLTELDCLNYLAAKAIIELTKEVPTETEELVMLDNANNRLRRMENRLDLATKRFCLVNSNNKQVREEINRLLVERNDFNKQWNRIIGRLVKGKQYLMDILEVATLAFGSRDECCRKLETLKKKGLDQLNRDISEMQSYDGEINHLAKLEEFLRVKGTRRLCEADEKEAIKRKEERDACREQVNLYDELLEEIFEYAGTTDIATITKNFQQTEAYTYSGQILLCEITDHYLSRELAMLRQRIYDQNDRNWAVEENEKKTIQQLTIELEKQRILTQRRTQLNEASEATIVKVLRGVDELVKMARCDTSSLLPLLGNHQEVTKWNVRKFLSILELEVKSLVQVAYGAVKPPRPHHGQQQHRPTQGQHHRLSIADPSVQILRPNRIEKLVPYTPCAYCVEDYIMNLVFETPAVPADMEYIESIFHLEEVNTKFGIYTLTIPTKLHPFRDLKKD